MNKLSSIWERLTGKHPIPKDTIYNPLGAKIGTAISINTPDYQEETYEVSEIREINRCVNENNHQFSDYVLKENLRVRVVPCLEKAIGNKQIQVLVLSRYDEIAFSQELLDLVTKNTQFEINNSDTSEQIDFFRPSYDNKSRMQLTWETSVTTRKKSGEGLEINLKSRMSYWDYSRETKDEAKQDYVDYLFVEMNKDNGMFQLWRGVEVDPHRISIV